MIVAVMTTALAGTAWAQGDYSTDYTGNVTLSTTGGTSASACVVKIQQVGTTTVNSYEGIKAGTSSKTGAVKITVPSGTKYLHLHTAAWNNESVTLAVSPSVYSDDISLTSDSGVSGNSPFTLGSYNKASTDYYKVITFESALTEATDLTFTAKSGKRFVVWGVTAEVEGSSLAVATSVVIDDSNITNTDVHVSDEAGSLSATVVAGETTLSAATVTWSGDNDAVATIDASTGAVTLVGAGVVTFTAAYAGVSGEYKASSANYEMTVTDSTPFTGGDVTFDATADKGNTSAGEGSIVKNGVTFYCSNGILGNGSEYRIYKNSVTTFTLSADAVASGYVIKSIAFTCTGNPASGFGDQEGWTTEGNNGTWTGAATSVSFTASNAQVRATEIVVTVGQAAALSSITLSGDYPTTFHVGDAFSHEGIVVTATYEDATTRDVTASAEFTGYDMETAGAQTVTVSYSEGEVTATANYDITVNAPATLLSITLSGTYPTEFGQGDAFSSEGIIVIANFDDNTTADVTAEATFTGYDMDVLGEQTVTVSYEGQEATYTITIVEKKGTATNPYTVAEAIAYIGTLGSATSATEVYVSGIISQVDSYNSKYSSITYWISDNGTTEGQMEVYSGKGIDGADFASVDDLQVGDIVTVKGFVKMYNTTPEFTQNNQLVSLDRPVVTTPTITANPTSLTGFTYVVDNGPSAAQTFTINGVNLTGNLNAVLDAASNFEVSVNENSDYSDHVYSDASVLPRTIYVRQKEGLAVGDYSGTITLTSEGAEAVTVALAGSVTAPEAPNVTWDLSVASYDEVTDPDVVTWSSTCVTMTNTKGSGSTAPSNYLGGDSNNRTSSRFYNGNNLTIAPALGYKITSIEFVATSENYASVLKNSDWTNAEVAVSGTTVTVTPTDGSAEVSAAIGGTCGFTSVKVYYETLADFAPVWSALPTPTITAGDAYEFYPSDYVAGLPAPSITLETTAPADTYDYDNGYFLFASDTAGEYTFTFTATNTEGSASATLTITVEDAPLPVASIDLGETTISAPYEGLDGTIDVTYNNLTDVLAEVQFVEADGTTPATYSWVAANIDTNRNIEYIIEENTSTDARTAYMKVYAVGNEGDAYSELITITQAGYVVDYATLPFVWTGGTKEDLLAENGVTAHDLGKNYADSNAPYLVKLDTDGDYIEVKTDCQPVLVTMDVKMLGGGNTSTITVQESNDGTTFTDVEDLTIEGTQNDVLYLQTASAFDAATRYVRLYFTKGSNVGVGGITIEKEFEEIATVGAAGYATYVTKHNVAFPADVAYIGAVNENSVSMTAVTAVPKGTPLILKGEGTYTLSLASASELADVSGNELKVSETDVVADGTQYILAKPANEPVGFYQATGTIPAGKAYLVVPSSSVKAFYFSFDDDATGIEMVNGQSSMVNDPIFNIAGQRIQKLQRGINIVGGKKVMVK